MFRKGNSQPIIVVGNGTKTIRMPDDKGLTGQTIKGLYLLPGGGFFPEAGTSETTTSNISALVLKDSKDGIVATIPGQMLVANSTNTMLPVLSIDLAGVDWAKSLVYTTTSVPNADVAFVFIIITE